MNKKKFAEYIKQINEKTTERTERTERIEKARNSLTYFLVTYFPHYATFGLSDMHVEIARDLEFAISSGGKYAYAAPRGHAKTTLASKIYPLWLTCFNKKKFIVEISDSVELAESNLEAIKKELEDNELLRMDYPHVCGTTNVWKVGEFITSNGVKFKACGSGKRLRGLSNRAQRPDVVILDDLENDTNVRSKTQRDKLEEWLDEAVLNLGSADGSLLVVYIGTVLHEDSVLSRKLKLPYWHTRRYASIISYPYNMDLWDVYCELYLHNGLDAAQKYYSQHRVELDAGAKVLWEQVLPIDALMRKRAENPRAFSKEQLNSPMSDRQMFKLSDIKMYDNIDNLDYYVTYVDPAGGGNKSDYTAITTLGVKTPKIYVVESIVKRMDSRATIDTLIALQRMYANRFVGIETNGGQIHIKQWLQVAAANAGVHMPIKGVCNTTHKINRIETLEMPIINGEILLRSDQRMLIDQLLEFPEGQNDDAPDSLAGAYALVKDGLRTKRTHYLDKKTRRYNVWNF